MTSDYGYVIQCSTGDTAWAPTMTAATKAAEMFQWGHMRAGFARPTCMVRPASEADYELLGPGGHAAAEQRPRLRVIEGGGEG